MLDVAVGVAIAREGQVEMWEQALRLPCRQFVGEEGVVCALALAEQ